MSRPTPLVPVLTSPALVVEAPGHGGSPATGTPRSGEREHVRPIVSARPMPTAHPLPEVWPALAEPLWATDAPPAELAGRRERDHIAPIAPRRPARRPRPAAQRPPLLTLAAMDEPERARRFAALQRKLARPQAGRPGEAIVVVPSRAIDKWQEAPAETRAYEERLLCLLLLLGRPHQHVVYVTSERVDRRLVEYYLSLLPAGRSKGARERLTLLSAGGASRRPLADRLLGRPRALQRIRSAIPDPDRCHLVPYATTGSDRDLALLLGIPMYGADPRHARFGTKSGCRELFDDEGVSHPVGVENVGDLAAAVSAIAWIRAAKPEVRELVMKLNEGVSGDGNAIVDLRALPRPGAPRERELIEWRLRTMAFEAAGASFDAYLAKLIARGAIVEERITGAEVRSPSVQLQITPTGELQVISTHDQLLGGPSGQSYLGCRFPADPGYAPAITEEARKVGRRLAREGVIGRFAIDFIAVRDRGRRWRTFAIEINLRKGGTTHPFLTLQLLTAGTYHPETARYTSAAGRVKHLVASDHVEDPRLRSLELGDVLEIIGRRGLGFDHASQTGVVAHMLSAVNDVGRLGLTTVGDTAEAADLAYRLTRDVLLEEADHHRRRTSRMTLRALVRAPA